MSGYRFSVGSSGYDDEDRLVNWQHSATSLIVARHSVSGLAAADHNQGGQQTIADYPSSTVTGSPTYTYVYASYIDESVMRGDSGSLRYYHRNQQYSITALTNGGGTITEPYAYTAYGQVTFFDGSGSQISNSEISNRYTYTGREWDEGLSLYHYRARMYDSVGGRFVSRDPIGFYGGTGLYRYADASPVLKRDSQGLKCEGGLVSTSPRSFFNIQWSDRPMQAASGRAPWGFTAKCIEIRCNCVPCDSADCCRQDGDFFAVECTISISFHIFLNLAQIELDGLDPDKVYGHEQRHVRNYIRESRRIQRDYNEPNSLPADGCLQATECEDKRRERLFEIYDDFDDRAVDPIGMHRYPDFLNPVPDANQPEYPIFGRRPDQSASDDCHARDLQRALGRN